MALIHCPACDKQVSSNAPACPSCGEPINIAPPEKKKRAWYHWLFLTFGTLFFASGVIVILKGVQMMKLKEATSISTDYTIPATVLFCVGVFCAIAPLCKKR